MKCVHNTHITLYGCNKNKNQVKPVKTTLVGKYNRMLRKQ